MAVYPEITAFHKLRYIKVLNLKLLQTEFKRQQVLANERKLRFLERVHFFENIKRG